MSRDAPTLGPIHSKILSEIPPTHYLFQKDDGGELISPRRTKTEGKRGGAGKPGKIIIESPLVHFNIVY